MAYPERVISYTENKQYALVNYDGNCTVLYKALENVNSICVRDSRGNVFLVNYDSGPQELFGLIEMQSREECVGCAVDYPNKARSWVLKTHANGTIQWR
mmetsp:Transcript_64060/g.75832  ORF Transcript_64060/g.75832 Transcript_64060/m.75832 type:complete len:99 (+) Transcript_64060:693-989(+)